MSFELEFSSEAENQLAKLDHKTAELIFKKLQELKSNPFLGKPLKNIFKNKRSLHIGKYRAIYSIKENKIIVARVKHRKRVYK